MTFEEWREKYKSILDTLDVSGESILRMWEDAYTEGYNEAKDLYHDALIKTALDEEGK